MDIQKDLNTKIVKTYVSRAANASTGEMASCVNDVGKATKRWGLAPMSVMSLSDGASWMTALVNDDGYERLFFEQLENLARCGDVLVIIFATDNSLNLARDLERSFDARDRRHDRQGEEAGGRVHLDEDVVCAERPAVPPAVAASTGLEPASRATLVPALLDRTPSP